MRRVIPYYLTMSFYKILLATLFFVNISTSASAATDNTFRFRLPADPTTLDWNIAHTSNETYILTNIMEGLFEQDQKLELQPALAESWTISPNGKIYTITLRKGVKWTDGRVLQSSDFTDSWLRLLTPETNARYASFLFEIENAEAFHSGKIRNPAQLGIKAIDKQHLEIRLRQPVPYFLSLLSFWVTFPIRKDLIEKTGVGWMEPSKLVTLGPYNIQEWTRGKQIILKKNENYYRRKLTEKAPEIVHARIESDDAFAKMLFDQGKIDAFLHPTTEDLIRVKTAKQTSVRTLYFPYLATYYLGLNTRLKPFQDARVRKALSQSINVQEIPSILQGGQVPASGLIPPGLEGHSNINSINLNLYEARAALAKAGYPEGRGFPRIDFHVEKFNNAEALAKFISSSWKEHLGIEATIKIGVSSEDKHAFIRHWGADYPDASNFFDVFLKSSGNNWTGWSSKEYDRLIHKAQYLSDINKRNSLYASAEQLLIEKDSVILPLFYQPIAVLLNSRIKTFTITPLNYLFFKDVILN